MGAGASKSSNCRASTNPTTERDVFFVANASSFVLQVRGESEPEARRVGIQEVVECRGEFVSIILIDHLEAKTPLCGLRPVNQARALIVTNRRSIKKSRSEPCTVLESCALESKADPNAWIDARTCENHFPNDFYVANSCQQKIAVLAVDNVRNDVTFAAVRPKECAVFRGSKTRIFTTTGEEIHNAEVRPRVSLIIRSEKLISLSAQMIGTDNDVAKWTTESGEYCKQRRSLTFASAS